MSRFPLTSPWFAALLFATTPIFADTFHPISSINTSTTDLYVVGNLIQGAGTGFDAADPYDRLLGGSAGTWVTNVPNGADYYSNGEPSPVLVIDMGQNRQLSEISTWGYANSNTNGAKDFSLRFATAGEGAGGFGTSISYNPSFIAGFDATDRDSHLFTQAVFARYVEVTITDNWRGFQGGTPGGDRVGLGEIAFEDAVPPPDPRIEIAETLGLNLDGSVQLIDVPVGNLGATLNLVLGTPTFTGTHAAAFSLVASPATVAPGGGDLIQVSFNPTGITGFVDANLVVTSNDTTEPTSVVAMSGFLHDPKLAVAGLFNIGAFPSGSGVQAESFAIANDGGGQVLTISSATITGSNAGNFSITSSPTNLAPLTGGTITISFDPMGSDGLFSAQLELATNDALTPLKIVNLSALVGDAIPDAGVRINEFMASNDSTINDGDGNSSDWIELYNAGPGAVDLGGWFLTDNDGNLNKWEFPAGTNLAEGGYLLVFASGQITDDYVDGGGFLHTSFKLTAAGEYLALVMPNGTTISSEFSPAFPAQFNDVSYGTFAGAGTTADLIVSSDADFLVPTNGSLGLTWTFSAFVPGAGWSTGGTGSGVGYDFDPDYDPYIDIDVQAELYNGGNSIFVRIPFNVADTSAITELQLRMRYDDGFHVYLNGEPIANRNAPASPVWNSVSEDFVDEGDNLAIIDVSTFLPHLQNGDNVLAIHGFNQSAGSGDFLAAPELIATTTSGNPLLAGYLNLASPGAANGGGFANPGPEVPDVTHTPAQPTATEDIIVTAMVAPRLIAVGPVDLTYRVGYGTETSIAMVDDGTGDDALAGDSVFTATIPETAYGPEEMVRWFVSAQDTAANPTRVPAFLDQTGKNRSPEYFGTVTQDPSVTSGMPIFQWFTTSTSASHTRTGVRASAWFDGRFYDNVFVRQRGGATNGSISQKFDFNKGDSLYIDADMPSVGEINMNGNGADGTYIRQTLAFDAHRAAGNAACLSELWQMRVNGNSDRVGVFIEQVDGDFLKRNGYDRDGELYKMVQRGNLDPVFADTVTGIEKKIPDKVDLTTLDELVAGLGMPPSAARRAWVIDNLDLPQIVNYLAARSITQDADDLRKNFYMFRDTRGDCRWRQLPWDKDYTFGVTGDGGTHLPHPFFGDEEHQKQNANQWNVLYDVIFEEQVTQRLYLRRLRTVMEEVLEPSSTPLATRYLENRATEIITPASPPLGTNTASIDNYLVARRSVLFNNYPSLIPATQPSNPVITMTAVDANPASTNQDQEYIRLSNAETTEIDISGWTLEGGVTFTFRPGTVIERGGDLYVSPDTKAFQSRSVSPTGGEELLSVGPYSSHLSNFSETLVLKDAAGAIVDTFATPNAPSDPQLYLVVSEIMYHPAAPNEDAEFIELVNISDSVTLDLEDVHFSAGIDFTFGAGDTLAPGERVLIVLNQSAFEAVHGSGLNIAGEFQNGSRLNNGSDHIKLEDATNSTIFEFSYDDDLPWPTAADGGGHSLALRNPGSKPDYDLATSWRESATMDGNPGGIDSSSFTGNPNDDLDGDGIHALLEHAFGTSDSVPNVSPLVVSTSGGVLSLTVIADFTADDVAISLEQSTALTGWTDAATDIPLISATNNGDGTVTLLYESAAGFVGTNDRQFLRLRVDLIP